MIKRRRTESQKALLNAAENDERLTDNLAQTKLLSVMMAHPRASINYLAVSCGRSTRTVARYIAELKALAYLAGNPRYLMKKLAGRLRWLRDTNQWAVGVVEKLAVVAQVVAGVAKLHKPSKLADRFIDRAAVQLVARSANADPDGWAAILKNSQLEPVTVSAALLKTALVKRR